MLVIIWVIVVIVVLFFFVVVLGVIMVICRDIEGLGRVVFVYFILLGVFVRREGGYFWEEGVVRFWGFLC